MKRKTTEIELLGRKFLLYERSAGDVIALSKFANENDGQTLEDIVYKSLQIIDASLVWNYHNLPWYKYFKKRNIQKLLSQKHLIKHLSSAEIFDLAEQVLILEGLVPQKKSSGEKKKDK